MRWAVYWSFAVKQFGDVHVSVCYSCLVQVPTQCVVSYVVVPHTKGETSLCRMIESESLAQLKYDDKQQLILVICDGNIVGSGNDHPTPRIVLNIPGAGPNLEPEVVSFVSLGSGARQHNMGKAYSGLYECTGHIVP